MKFVPSLIVALCIAIAALCNSSSAFAQDQQPSQLAKSDGMRGLSETEKSLVEAIFKSHENVLKVHEENATRLGWLMTVLPGALFGMGAIVVFWLGSSLKDVVTNQVLLEASGQLKQKQSDFSRLRSAIDEIEKSAEVWKRRIGELNISSSQLDAFISQTSKTRDYSGELLVLRNQIVKSPNPKYDPDLRKIALATLTSVKVGVKELHADELYNAAAVAGKLEMSDLATWYMRAAFEKDRGNPVYETRMLRHEIELSGDQKSASKIIVRVLELVKQAQPPSCELIYSEAWNIAEHLRRYPQFIEAFEAVASRPSGAPSYAHVILAQLYMREGRKDWRVQAQTHAELARRLLGEESMKSTWFNSSARELRQVEQELSLGPDDIQGSDGGADGAGLEELMAALKSKMAQGKASAE